MEAGDIRARARDSRSDATCPRCPCCREDVALALDAWVVCRSCLSRHHAACWKRTRTCSSCGGRAALGDRRRPARAAAVGLVALALLVSGLWLGLRSPSHAPVRHPKLAPRVDASGLTAQALSSR
ncbi:hypothetical protein HY251_00265, partial [bacterium]|nr:hypothetical protein [bacterium]